MKLSSQRCWFVKGKYKQRGDLDCAKQKTRSECGLTVVLRPLPFLERRPDWICIDPPSLVVWSAWEIQSGDRIATHVISCCNAFRLQRRAWKSLLSCYHYRQIFLPCPRRRTRNRTAVIDPLLHASCVSRSSSLMV